MVLLLVVVRADVVWLQCLSPVLCWVTFSLSLRNTYAQQQACSVLGGMVDAHVKAERVFLSALGARLLDKLVKSIGVKSGFPSSELLLWPHKRPPHWDYLVICSPNFYEVAFPL